MLLFFNNRCQKGRKKKEEEKRKHLHTHQKCLFFVWKSLQRLQSVSHTDSFFFVPVVCLLLFYNIKLSARIFFFLLTIDLDRVDWSPSSGNCFHWFATDGKTSADDHTNLESIGKCRPFFFFFVNFSFSLFTFYKLALFIFGCVFISHVWLASRSLLFFFIRIQLFSVCKVLD